MHDNRTHPLLAQIPLTVSPFINLPTATTLPYTYKQLPTTLPPSNAGITATSSSDQDPSAKPKYIISQTGHAAHPDDIIASCRALQAHIAKLQSDAEAEIAAFDERVRARDLAEKRRLAPGWLDSDVRVLEPERKNGGNGVGEGMEVVMEEEMKRMSLAGFDGQGGFDGFGGPQGQAQGYGQEQGGHGQGQGGHGRGGASEMAVPDEGEELDRAFGGMGLGKSGGN